MALGTQLDPRRVHEAFAPAMEIHDPDLFVGRREEIAAGIDALLNPGGFLAIYGPRGVGKSSISYQIKGIAEGKSGLPKRLGLAEKLPKRGFNYIVHYCRCDDFIANIGDLLKRLAFGDNHNRSLFSFTKGGEKRLAAFKKIIEAEGSAKLFGVGVRGKGIEEASYTVYISDDFIQQFRQLLGTIERDQHKAEGLLILIDEFDTLRDKTRFASIVKACSSRFVKFGIVGIASNLSELVEDHSSIGRQFDLIRVPLMPHGDLMQILKNAERKIELAIRFEESAKQMIAARSEGFPFFTHLLGKQAMLVAMEAHKSTITVADVELLKRSIAEGRLSTIYEDVYHKAVKGSTQRELLLKAFADVPEVEIHSPPVFSLAKDLGISKPADVVRGLLRQSFPILTKVRPKYYRFTDPVFKVYARLRSWKF